MASDMVNLLILCKPPTADSAVWLYAVWLLANTHSDYFNLMQESFKVQCQVHFSFKLYLTQLALIHPKLNLPQTMCVFYG